MNESGDSVEPPSNLQQMQAILVEGSDNESDDQLCSCVEALKLLKLLYYHAIILHHSTKTLSQVT